jgi:hypothetical protein
MCAKKAAPSPAAKKKPAGTSRKPSAAAVSAEINGAAPPAAPTTATKKTVPVKAAATTTLKAVERTLSTHDIGLVAGEIWGFLAEKEPQTLAAIKKAVTAPADVIAAAIGWLAREDKLEFTTSGRTLKIGLKS